MMFGYSYDNLAVVIGVLLVAIIIWWLIRIRPAAVGANATIRTNSPRPCRVTLRSIYPDHPPYDWQACPWMSMPLDVGIDHVFMNLSWSMNDEVIGVIERLAAAHSLVLYDQQDGVVRKSGVDRDAHDRTAAWCPTRAWPDGGGSHAAGSATRAQ
jgi:hypothetical protein